ncbi:MAG: hypothetical protein ABR909_02610 [Candidatus Bathyarchaeia archaeon]|jgi:hypothetical protein
MKRGTTKTVRVGYILLVIFFLFYAFALLPQPVRAVAVTATVPVGSFPWGVAVTPNGAYAYVTNGGINTMSVVDTLAAPTVSASPTTVDQTQTSTLSVSGDISGGAGLFSYQWMAKAPGALSYSTLGYATSSATSISTGSLTLTGSWSFELKVTDSAGAVVASNVVTVTVSASPTVSIAPAGPLTMDVGQVQVFMATASGGSGTINYQWYLDGSAVGSNSASYSYTASGTSHSVTCKVTDSASVPVTSAASSAVTITVSAVPAVSIAPVGPVTLDAGQAQTFTASASGGTGTLTYQWYLNGSPVGSDSNTYSFSGSAGSYSVTCKVTDSANTPVTSAASNAVSVTVNPLPSPNLSFYCISSTTTSGFNVQIQGSLTYNGVGLSGAGIQLSDSVTGGATWQDLAYVNTDNNGSFSVTWTPSASGNDVIKATWPGDGVYSSVSTISNFAVAPFNNQNQNVFSVTSNSTLTSLTFDSTTNELSFGVSGPSGTTGFTEVCIPQSLIPDISKINVTLDGGAINYTSVSENNVWIITFTYHHSSHTIVIALGSTPTTTVPEFPSSVILSLFIILAVSVAVMLVLRKARKATQPQG